MQILTPSQQTEAPETWTRVAEGGQKKGVEIEGFHQEPEEVGHHAVVAEDHRRLTGELRKQQTGRNGGSSRTGRAVSTGRRVRRTEIPSWEPYGGQAAVVGVLAGEQGGVFDEHRHGFQHEGDEELDVNEVPGAAQPPVREKQAEQLFSFAGTKQNCCLE